MSQLEQAEKDDGAFKKREQDSLASQVELDTLKKELKVQTLEREALQGELAESRDLIKDKELQLERIYRKMSEKKVKHEDNKADE